MKLSAPTGVAAYSIGVTLHSALLGQSKNGEYQSLSHDKSNTKLAKLKLIIIDEVSTVGCNMLHDRHKWNTCTTWIFCLVVL